MPTARPLILVHGSMPAYALESLRRHFELEEIAQNGDTAGIAPERLAATRGIATRSMVGVSGGLMRQLPKLEIVSLFGVGADAVDLAEARRRAIRVTNTPGVLTEDTADYAIGLIFALARRIVEGDRFVRSGFWPKGPLPDSTRIRGRAIGIAGLGRIGMAVARRAKALGMTVHWSGPRDKPEVGYIYHATLIDLARASDFLVLTLPGGTATEGAVDTAVLDALGPGGYLINIARGSVINDEALIAALAGRRIAGAALDVFRNEPNIPKELLRFENVILEPHIASTTAETRRDIADLMVANLVAHFDDREPPAVLL